MNFLLAIFENNNQKKLDFSEAFSGGIQILVLGMLAVFAVLIVIWGSLLLLKIVLHDLPAKRKAETNITPVQAPVAPIIKSSADDEIIAVIAAAVAMAESESSGMKFRVVSFRRK